MGATPEIVAGTGRKRKKKKTSRNSPVSGLISVGFFLGDRLGLVVFVFACGVVVVLLVVVCCFLSVFVRYVAVVWSLLKMFLVQRCVSSRCYEAAAAQNSPAADHVVEVPQCSQTFESLGLH